MTVQTEARNATLADLAQILEAQQDAKHDFVAPAETLRSKGGVLHAKSSEVTMDADGVSVVNGVYRPTAVFDEGIAAKLNVPLAYIRRLRTERPDLYDANVNGWLHGKSSVNVAGERFIAAAADDRSFLVRTFKGVDGDEGVARAFLSNSYAPIDNLDVLTAALDGVRQSGVEVDVTKCDLTDRRMYVRVSAPSVSALAPELLAGYRSPYSGQTGDENPLVFAGFIIANSEVGDGAFTLTPSITVQICTNGMTMTKDAFRAVHLGAKLEDGIVKWSADTQSKSLALVTAKARDAVAMFLDGDYVRKAVAQIERVSSTPIDEVEKTIDSVVKKMAFTETARKGILNHFIQGGQLTAGGILQSITSYCQTVEDADDAYDMEFKAIAAMEYAASLAK